MRELSGNLGRKPQTEPLTTGGLRRTTGDLNARIDPKGKIFTEKVRTDPIEVNLVTTQGRINGFIHVQPGQRVKDFINNPHEQFLAITDATIRVSNDDANPIEVEFIAINKTYIISAIPLDEERAVYVEEEYIAF